MVHYETDTNLSCEKEKQNMVHYETDTNREAFELKRELTKDIYRWISRALVWQGIAHTIRCLPNDTFDIGSHLDDLSNLDMYVICKDNTLTFANDSDGSIIMSLNMEWIDPYFACNTMADFIYQYLF